MSHRRGDVSRSPTLRPTAGGGSVFSQSYAHSSVYDVAFSDHDDAASTFEANDGASSSFSDVAPEPPARPVPQVQPAPVPSSPSPLTQTHTDQAYPYQVPQAPAPPAPDYQSAQSSPSAQVSWHQVSRAPAPPTNLYHATPSQLPELQPNVHQDVRASSRQATPYLTQSSPLQQPNPYQNSQTPAPQQLLAPSQYPPTHQPPAKTNVYHQPHQAPPSAQADPYQLPPTQQKPSAQTNAYKTSQSPHVQTNHQYQVPPAQTPEAQVPPTSFVPPVEEVILDGNEELRRFFEDLVDKTAIEKYIKLPWVIVVGATSSGKSMLLSHLANIELPSNHEITTCVPIEIHMHRSQDERKASISVELLEDARRNVTPFRTQEVDESQWNSISEKILGAQQYILNIRNNKVAKDRVVVHIWDKSVEDLTLVDLPGTVQVVCQGDPPTLISDIREMLDDYLSNPNCIIVTVLPASVEIHNSGILMDARKVDPSSRRTLPVITKPDQIQPGTEREALELLSGRKTAEYCNGFQMVMGRSQQDLDRGVTIEQGIRNEAMFFAKPPWSNVRDRRQLGIQNLRTKLGRLQLEKFRSSIPGILHVVRTQKAVLEEELDAMGDGLDKPGDRRVLFTRFCNQLVHHLRTLLLGHELLHGEDHTVSSKMYGYCTDLKVLVETGKLATLNGEDVAWIQQKIDRMRTPPLSLFPDKELFQHIVKDCITSDWAPPCTRFVKNVSSTLEGAVIQALDHTWRNFLGQELPYTELKLFIRRCCQSFLKAATDQLDDEVNKYVSRQQFPWTQDSALFTEVAEKPQERALTQVATKVTEILAAAVVPEEDDYNAMDDDSSRSSNGGGGTRRTTNNNNPLTALLNSISDEDEEGPNEAAATGQEAFTKAILNAHSRDDLDLNLDEINAQHLLDALIPYGRIASKRFIDEVPIIAWHHYRELPDLLLEALQVIEEEDYRYAMQDTPEMVRTRAKIKLEVAELDEVLRAFENLHFSY